MLIAAIYIGVNPIVDILYGVLDPRIRVSLEVGDDGGDPFGAHARATDRDGSRENDR